MHDLLNAVHRLYVAVCKLSVMYESQRINSGVRYTLIVRVAHEYLRGVYGD